MIVYLLNRKKQEKKDMERSEEMVEKLTYEELDKVNGGLSIDSPVKLRNYAGYSHEQNNNNSLNNGNNETLKGFVVGQVIDGNCIA